jgi:hypothetical protein
MPKQRELCLHVYYRVIINDCSRSRPCPCYEIFALSCELSIFVVITVIFSVKSAVIFFKLTIESKNIKLFCNQF